MRIKIVNPDVEITKDEKIGVEKRLALALSRFGDRIALVRVQLTSVDAKNPNVGTKCRIVVTLGPVRQIVAEDQDADLQVAIDRAAELAARTVKRKLDREMAELPGPANLIIPGK